MEPIKPSSRALPSHEFSLIEKAHILVKFDAELERRLKYMDEVNKCLVDHQFKPKTRSYFKISNRHIFEAIGVDPYHAQYISRWRKSLNSDKIERMVLVNGDGTFKDDIFKSMRVKMPQECKCAPFYIHVSNEISCFRTTHMEDVVQTINSETFTNKCYNPDTAILIRNRADELEDDKEVAKRIMVGLAKNSLAYRAIKSFFHHWFPNHKLRGLLLLIAQPQLKQQVMHTDFNCVAREECWRCRNYVRAGGAVDHLNVYIKDTKSSYSFLIGVEPDTRIKMFPNRDHEVELNLDIGDIVIWRYDTLHCGSEYNAFNRRIFGVLEGSEVPYQYNNIYMVNDSDVEESIINSTSSSSNHVITVNDDVEGAPASKRGKFSVSFVDKGVTN